MTDKPIRLEIPATGSYVVVVQEGQVLALGLTQPAADIVSRPIADLLREIRGQLALARAPEDGDRPPAIISWRDIRHLFVEGLTGRDRVHAYHRAKRTHLNLCSVPLLVRRYCTNCFEEPGVCQHHRLSPSSATQVWYRDDINDWVFDVASLAAVTEQDLVDRGINARSRPAFMRVVAHAQALLAQPSA